MRDNARFLQDGRASAVLEAIATSPNPDYRVDRVVNVFPHREAAEMLGATAGRVYFREQNTLYAVLLSDGAMRALAHALLAALGDGPQS
jgi:hypothetical protein